jgi:hypothetical protein
MLKSEAERVVRRAMEETGAEFTEEQIEALCRMIPKIAATVVEEAFSNQGRGSGGGKGGFYAG